jgi:GNAT superfamily N-acetyltransferase
MNGRRVEIRGDLKEVETEGLVHKGGEQIHGQGPRIDTRVSILAATPSDGAGLRAMFSRATTETIYRRFHMPYPDVPEWMLSFMLDAGHHAKEALVAIAQGEVVGHAMYARLGDGTEAEMAIIVEDGWQSKGVGKLLLRTLAEGARRRGVQAFVGTVLLENRRVLGLIDAVFTGSSHVIADGAYLFRVPLRTLKPTHSVRTLRRAA